MFTLRFRFFSRRVCLFFATRVETLRLNMMCHLGNVSMKLGRSVRWYPEKGEIAGDPEANSMCSRLYRKPWTLMEEVRWLKRSC